MKLLRNICLLLLITYSGGYSQPDTKKQSEAFVDNAGVLRWKNTNEEVKLFGVNYTTPFAYSYRAHKKLGLDIKKAIDLDVAQMVRLGFDAFRVHVWDREISDRDGNILNNEHLDLFDYLISRLNENGIKSIITPIAWWATGWPEPDVETPGFSQLYSKVELVTNAKARESQKKYLDQFINHVNPYTKISYKNDPSVIAIEIVNEPKHPGNEQQVTGYINEMYDVLRNAGLTKPIFYNISENWNHTQANAVSKSKAEGISFQWYPTGLVHGKMLEGNYLINVNKYLIPSEGVAQYNKKSKMVYEFDAADIGGSVMYPAMARSYREAGMQFAAMFSYDPSQIAWSNTEYPTHYLNLLYTPSKAISLMIAGRAFHSLPRNKSFGEYPSNNIFNEFSVSYDEDLSVMNSDTEFYYTSNTKSTPKNNSLLTHIAGSGSSPVVKYDGTGAYFLDKLEKGIWQLEVYPDAVWLKDPFEQTSLSRQVARLFWNERSISVNLTDLGSDYVIYSLSTQNQSPSKASGPDAVVKPGIYILAANKIEKGNLQKFISAKKIFLEGLFVPEAVSPDVYVINKTGGHAVAASHSMFNFQIAGREKIESANLFIKRLGWRGFKKYPLKNVGGFSYAVDDTSKFDLDGIIQYCVTVKSEKSVNTYPGGISKNPEDWDFSQNNLWEIKISKPGNEIVLFDAARDQRDLISSQFDPAWRYSVNYSSGSNSDNSSLALKILFENQPTAPFGIQLNVSKITKAFSSSLNQYGYIVIKGKNEGVNGDHAGINLLMKDGKCFSAKVKYQEDWREIKIPLSEFKNDSALILPNSYPLFLQKIWKSNAVEANQKLDLNHLQFIQIACDKPKSENKNDKSEIAFSIESIKLVSK